MVENSNTLYENEIDIVDSPSNENSKNIYFFPGTHNFVGKTTQKFIENGQKQGNLLLWKLESGQF